MTQTHPDACTRDTCSRTSTSPTAGIIPEGGKRTTLQLRCMLSEATTLVPAEIHPHLKPRGYMLNFTRPTHEVAERPDPPGAAEALRQETNSMTVLKMPSDWLPSLEKSFQACPEL